MSGEPFSVGFDPPPPPRTERMQLAPLGPAVVELDYAAIMGSRVRLREELQWRGWPREGFSLEDNRRDLEEHLAEFERREAYAYTVLDPAGTRCLGCIYLEPWSGGGGRLAFWVIDEEIDGGLEAHLIETVLRWIETSWPLARVVLPLRPAHTRGIAVLRTLGLHVLEEGGSPEHVSLVWNRSH